MESSSADAFKVKWTKFKGRHVPFLLQNLDGQCPLICLSNILFLNRRLELPKGCKQIQFESLCTYISSALQDFNSEWVTSILISLKKGLLFNCKFDSTKVFIESDAEQLFQTFGIPIKHGWIPDPIAYGPLTRLNYDELLEKLTIYQCKKEEDRLKSCVENDLNEENSECGGEEDAVKEEKEQSQGDLEGEFEQMKLSDDHKEGSECVSKEAEEGPEDKNDEKDNEGDNGHEGDDKQTEDEGKVDEKKPDGANLEEKKEDDDFNEDTATLALDFLERYATQLTEYGIKVLKHELSELKLVALYRNNHFLVVTMHNGKIFALVTDSAFYDHQCVWESLESSEYFDENFNHYVPKDTEARKPSLMDKWKKAFKRKPRR
ncbi:hypothetical protein MACJ_001377 [Theileria orientalis]|uniref:MINDY deubiquitinase domain-containing protein n=1 Tax=Theileria orientalis TaxID=68886 RepID=A0A976QRH1_THEOR|nr:hypothetical protein MACJ_001377 [Theileria orientalis]